MEAPPTLAAKEESAPGDFVIADAAVTGTSRAVTFGWFLGVVSWHVAMIASARHPWLPLLLWAVAGVFGVVGVGAALASMAARWRGKEKLWAKRSLNVTLRGRLRVGEDGLFVGGVRVLSRGEITRGQVDTTEEGSAVLVLHRQAHPLGRWLGPVSVELPTEEDARELSRALGTDLASTVMETAAGSPLERFWALPFAIALLASVVALLAHAGRGSWVNLVPSVAFLCAVVSTLPLSVTAKLRIGTDGVQYRWLGLRRYVSYRSVVGVTAMHAGVTLELSDGRQVSWRFPFVRHTVARLEEAIAAYRANATSDEARWLARGKRPREEWVRELREIGAGEGRGYRVSPPSKEALWRMVEDPAADVAARAASAVALGATLDDAGRQRLRVAAKVTALPELSAVLEREADEDAGAGVAEEALEALERKHALRLGG